MKQATITGFLLLTLLTTVLADKKDKEYPEGYYPFVKDPSRTPPNVRKPPYTQTEEICPGNVSKGGDCYHIDTHDALGK